MEELGQGPARDDLFICALGFEKRCTGALEKLARVNYRAMNSIVLNYDVQETDNASNAESLSELLNSVTDDKVIPVPYSTTSLTRFPDEIGSALQNMARKEHLRVSVDISSFNTSAIIQTLDFLFNARCDTIRVVYTEAADYYPKSIPESSNEEILSSGLKAILTLPNFSGVYTPGYSPMLIVLLGFEPIRARAILELFQPSRKIGIIGIPSKPDLMWRVDLAKMLYHNFFENPQEMRELSEFNYVEAYHALESLYGEFARSNNIAVAPLGSKMQTLAVFLFLRNHPDVQLLISIPQRYDPRRYTEGSGKSYQIIFRNEGIEELS